MRKMKSNIKYRLLIVLLLGICLCGCGSKAYMYERSEGQKVEQIRTDAEILKRWFPNLKGIQSAEWEVEVLGSNEQSMVPGPGAFRACGYIFLDEENAKQYRDSYKWIIVEPEVPMRLVDNVTYEIDSWNYSKEWEDEVKPGYYDGKFYFSDGIVMFDVVR